LGDWTWLVKKVAGRLKIDETDRKIIKLLTDNGRMSYVDIEKELELSRVAVRERVNQLINEDVIERFTVVVNSEKIGRSVSAFFEVDVSQPF
jgi:DNA-binding Lrp family transcriptional regulator